MKSLFRLPTNGNDSTEAFSKKTKKADFLRIKNDWVFKCEELGMPLGIKAMKEVQKRIDSCKDASGGKSKLDLTGASLTDKQVKALLEILAQAPVIAKIDLSKNLISDEGANIIKKLLRGQVKLIGANSVDARLDANFLCNVSLENSSLPIKTEILADIKALCDTLTFANAQACIRKVHLQNGGPEAISAQLLSKIWIAVLGKDDKNAIVQALSRGEVYGNQLLAYSEMETALLASLTASGLAPILSKQQRRAIEVVAVPAPSSEVEPPVAVENTESAAKEKESNPSDSPKPQSPRHTINKSTLEKLAHGERTHEVGGDSPSSSRSKRSSALTASKSSPSSPSSPVDSNAVARQVEAVNKRIADGGLAPLASTSTSEVISVEPAPQSSRPASPSRPPVAIPNESKPRSLVKDKILDDTDSTGMPTGRSARRHTMSSSQSVWSGPNVTFTKSPPKFLAYQSSNPLPEPTYSPNRPSESPSRSASPSSLFRPSDETKGEQAVVEKRSKRSSPQVPEALLNLSGLSLDVLSVSTITLSPPTTLLSIVVLNISRNNISDWASLDLALFKNLTELDCSSNRFRGAIPPKFIPASVTKLDMSNNEISDMEALLTCTSLHSLSIHHNMIKKFDGLPSTLEKLDLSHNLISSLFVLRLLSLSSKITDLKVAGNPITQSSGAEEKNKRLEWRRVLNSVLPLLITLDGVDVPSKHNASKRKASAPAITQSTGRLLSPTSKASPGSASKPSVAETRAIRKRQVELDLERSRCDEARRTKLQDSRAEYDQAFASEAEKRTKKISSEEMNKLLTRLSMSKFAPPSLAHNDKKQSQEEKQVRDAAVFRVTEWLHDSSVELGVASSIMKTFFALLARPQTDLGTLKAVQSSFSKILFLKSVRLHPAVNNAVGKLGQDEPVLDSLAERLENMMGFSSLLQEVESAVSDLIQRTEEEGLTHSEQRVSTEELRGQTARIFASDLGKHVNETVLRVFNNAYMPPAKESPLVYKGSKATDEKTNNRWREQIKENDEYPLDSSDLQTIAGLKSASSVRANSDFSPTRSGVATASSGSLTEMEVSSRMEEVKLRLSMRAMRNAGAPGTGAGVMSHNFPRVNSGGLSAAEGSDDGTVHTQCSVDDGFVEGYNIIPRQLHMGDDDALSALAGTSSQPRQVDQAFSSSIVSAFNTTPTRSLQSSSFLATTPAAISPIRKEDPASSTLENSQNAGTAPIAKQPDPVPAEVDDSKTIAKPTEPSPVKESFVNTASIEPVAPEVAPVPAADPALEDGMTAKDRIKARLALKKQKSAQPQE